MDKYFCPFRNDRCIGECCKFFRRVNHSDCVIVEGMNTIFGMVVSIDGIYNQLSDIKDKLES